MYKLSKTIHTNASLANFYKLLLQASVTNRFTSRCIQQRQAIKDFSEIPGPKRLPLLKNLYMVPSIIRNIDQMHEINAARFDVYGPIYRVDLKDSMVQLSRAEDVETVLRHEGKYPKRINLEPWLWFKEEFKLAKGVLLEEGEQWKRLRSQLDKRMLRKDFVSAYFGEFKSIAMELVAKVEASKQANQPFLPELEKKLFRWAIESSGFVVYETRLGGAEASADKTELIEAVQNIFISTNHLFFIPTWFNKIFLPRWHSLLTESWMTVTKTTKAIIGAKLKKLVAQDAAGVDNDASGADDDHGFIRHLLSSGLTEDEMCGNINELVLGAVETTSTTMLWLIHELVQQPELQEELFQQISKLPEGEPHCMEDLEKVSLVRAVVKETLRLYPVVAMIPRITAEDLVLSNYRVPKGTLVFFNAYRIGRSEDYFKDALEFNPHRWLRGEGGGEGASHKFAWMPFGFGTRSCIGRRLAELELHLLLIKHFRMTSADSSPVFSVNKSFPAPSRPLKITFTPRQK